jgi:hypothetical protein
MTCHAKRETVMQLRTLIGLSFLGIASITSVACSNAAPTMRNVTGSVPAADKITSVVAVQVGNAANTKSAAVDASGHFSITLPIGQRYHLTFLSNTQTVGALRYTSTSGAFKSDINVTHAPNAKPSLSPASEGSDDAETADDGADDDGDGIEDDGIDLGSVDNPANDDKYVPSQNPEQEADSDGDGESDSDDADDSAEDSGSSEQDSDGDGLPDVIDTDDNNDGVPDA